MKLLCVIGIHKPGERVDNSPTEEELRRAQERGAVQVLKRALFRCVRCGAVVRSNGREALP